MTTDRGASRIAVVGAGVMGANITAMALGYGADVLLTDNDPDVLGTARTRITQHLRHAGLLGALPADRKPGTLRTATEFDARGPFDAVVEAVTELTEVKSKVLREISTRVAPGTPVITNTSGIPVDELAADVDRPEDLIGTHFMNPTYLIRMVEVVRGARTGEATLARVTALMTALGRMPIVVGDAPGFVTSRLLHPMINDAARVVGEGTATVEAVDSLMEGCLGHPTGPLRTADLIGIDNLVDSLAALYERTGDEGCKPCELLLQKVREGALGRKSGRGFYDYGKALS